MRPDLAVIVTVESELYGDSFGIVRDIDLPKIAIEMVYMPPTGTVVTVHFHCIENDERKCELSMRAMVNCCRYYGETDNRNRVVWLYITDFIEDHEPVDATYVH